jgi:transposase-like protein
MPLFPLEIFFSVCCANIFGFHVLQGLINAVQKIWPDSEHRFCVRHMLQNFQKAGHKGETLKNDLWAIARSTNIPKWEKNMQKLQADSPAAYEWVEQLVPNTWIKSFFQRFFQV